MKSLAVIIIMSINTLSIAQNKVIKGCYSNCKGSGMSSYYLIEFNQDSTFNYSKRTGLSVDEAKGTYYIKENIINLNFEYVEPDSAYFYFKNSLNQMDSTLVQMPSLNLLKKLPMHLYLVKKKIFFHQLKSNKEARRSKFNLVRNKEQCL
ncbi:MAG: hypothetical protein COA33_003925 [Fluviicola sp.]|nr:hypothetical protein [Fluviicola sp.]